MRILTILFILSCSSTEKTGLKRAEQEIEENTILGSSESYFLPIVPKWANFHSGVKCFQKSETHYLNFNELQKAYSMKLDKMTEVQSYYNYSLFRMKNQRSVASIKAKSEILFEVIEKNLGKVHYFDFPRYKSYNLIAVDGLDDKSLKKKLIKFLDSRHMNNGVPILVSFCEKSYELEKRFEKLGLVDDYPYFIGSETLINYNEDLIQIPYQYLYLKGLFLESASIIAHLPYKESDSLLTFIEGINIKSIKYY